MGYLQVLLEKNLVPLKDWSLTNNEINRILCIINHMQQLHMSIMVEPTLI